MEHKKPYTLADVLKKTENKNNKEWTEEEIETLRELAASNTPTGLIENALNRTKSAIFNKANELGIKLDPPNVSPYGTQK